MTNNLDIVIRAKNESQSALNELDKSLGGLDKKTTGLSGSMGKLGGFLGKGLVLGAGLAATALGAMGAAAFGVAQSFEDAQHTLIAATGASGAALDGMSASVVALHGSVAGLDRSMADIAAVMGEVKTHFRPEFVNRIDEIVVFHALDEKHIAGIARIQLQFLEKRMAKLDMTLEVSDAALAQIAEAGFDPVFGARPLKRAIQERIENPLSRLILDGTIGAKDSVKVDVSKGQLSFKKA